MQEIINKDKYRLGMNLVLVKYPNATAKIVKINYTTITVILSSLDKKIDGKMFNIESDDIFQTLLLTTTVLMCGFV
jgi:hypothetical protein